MGDEISSKPRDLGSDRGYKVFAILLRYALRVALRFASALAGTQIKSETGGYWAEVVLVLDVVTLGK